MSEQAMKIAIITGASSGIGQSAAIQIARRGMGVIVTYNSGADGARETVAAIEENGGTAVALELDVGRSDTFPAFAERAASEMYRLWGRGTFDYLVNNAGFGAMAMFEDTSEELFDRFYRVLLKGPYFLTQTLLPMMTAGGAIVHTGSNATRSISPGYSAYAAMKGGLAVLTQYMAKELAGRRIRVNSVAPGPTRTGMVGDAPTRMPEVIAPLLARTAFGRLGEPDDVGRLIAALLSDDLAWVTAQNIEVSGGFDL